ILGFNCTEVYVNADEARFIPVKCKVELGNSPDGSLVQTTVTIDVPEEETEGYTFVEIDPLGTNQPYASGFIGGFNGEDNEEDYIMTYGTGNSYGVLFESKSTPIATKSFYDINGKMIRPIQYIAIFAAFIIAIVPAVIRYSINRRNYEIFEYRRKMTDAMAHDLKTPLAAISAYAENLQSHIGTDKQEHYAEKIIEKVDNMDKMVNDILMFSRSENSSGVIASEDFDTGDLIKGIIAENDQIIKDKELMVDIKGEEVTLKTDKTLFRQALGNLINNAVLYSKEKSTVTISYSKDQIKIVNDIADNVSGGTGLGIAIADNDLAMLKYKLSAGPDEDKYICVIRL
ncbi:MAG: HAMP domain-containing histidine kinase, partial [Clostridiales bacterium]|nr:HAMP domain-containing histidine kinase [Clostridiales bacterium]